MPPDDPRHPEQHEPDLAVYALGAMTPEEEAEFERQLADCPGCQEELPRLRASVAELEPLPEELFIEGPPEIAEFLVRGTLRRIAAEGAAAPPGTEPPPPVPIPRSPFGSGRRWLVAAAAAVVLLALGGVLGRQTAPAPVALPGPTPSVTASPPVQGTVDRSSTDPVTGARLAVKVVPALGWVRVTAATAGIAAGQRCHLLVVDSSGKRVEAGSWLVSPAGEKDGVTLQGSALVPLADVKAVQVRNDAGDVLVTTEV